MEKQILVPLDGSAFAEQALSYAEILGHGLPAELVLFCSVLFRFRPMYRKSCTMLGRRRTRWQLG